jgi:hypothetical protein
MDTEEERVRGVDQVMVGEAIDEALAVDPTTVDEVTVVQAWRHVVEERVRGWRGNDSSQG